MVPTGREDSRGTARRTRIGPRAGALLVLAGLVGLELLARSAGYGRGLRAVPHATRGWVRLPDQDLSLHGVRVRINERGFRDDAWPDPSARQSSPRIAVLGSSVTSGTRVDEHDRWTEVLERELRAAGSPVTVMNFAVPGYAFEQMAATYRETVRPYRPDLVLIEITEGASRPAPPPPEHRFLHRLGARLALWDWWLNEVDGFASTRPHAEPGTEDHRRLEAYRRVARRPLHASNREWWVELARGADALRRDIEERGGALRCVVLPRPSRFVIGEETLLLERIAPVLRERDLSLLDPTPALRAQVAPFREELASRGIDPRNVLLRKGPRGVDPPLESLDAVPFFPRDPEHWNAEGHRVIGAVLAERLLADEEAWKRAGGSPSPR